MWTRKRSSSAEEGGGDGEPLACPSCPLRYSLEHKFCDSCGMPLVYAGEASAERPDNEAHERARKIRPEFARGSLVRVAGGRNQAEAELIQNLLIEEGVPSVLRRSAGFDVPEFLSAGPRDVMVPESGAEAAHGVLLQADMAPTVAPPPVPGQAQRHAIRLLLAILGGGLVTALLTWAAIQLGGA